MNLDPCAPPQENVLRELFEAHVYKLLVSKELIGPDLIAKMRTRRHSGFHVYVGPSIMQKEDAVRIGLYIVSPRCRILHQQPNRKRNGSNCAVSRGLL